MAPLLVALLVTAAVSQVAVFSTTIYLHRAATHRSLVLNPVVEWVFRFLIWMTTGIVPRQWVAVHRKHHAFSDEEGDPHSPHLEGFWSVQLGNFFHYVRAARDPEVVATYAKDLQPDFWDRWVFDKGTVGVLIGIVGLCLVLGVGWGLAAAFTHGLLYVFFLSSSINGLCHYVGYRNFENGATNLQSIALLTAGEGLHNNHHGFPRSPKFSYRRSEFDPAWPVIRLLTMLKLARPYKTIAESEIQP